MTTTLREAWYIREVGPEFDVSKPGIYEWRIEGVGIYVGLSGKPLHKRLLEYPNNVRKMLLGLPWRKSSPRDYRTIQKELRKAHDADLRVTVVVLENCTKENVKARETAWIAQRRREEAAGGPKVLNGTEF